MENFVHKIYKIFRFEEKFQYVGYFECTELLNSTKNYVH